MLLPDKRRIVRLLRRYRAWERRMVAVPSDALVRRRFEDTAYTLCILMGRRTAHEAVLAAERYVRPRKGRGELRAEPPRAGGPDATGTAPLDR